MEHQHTADREFLEGTIGLGDGEPATMPDRVIFPVKTRVIKIGSSGGVLVSLRILKQLGFSVGDYVNVIMHPRMPTEEESEKENRKHQKTKRGK